MWTYIGDEANPYIAYDYTPDRTRAGPAAWLTNFKGYLQADAYGGYDGIYARGNGSEIIEVACWAHARRKFFEAKDTDGKRSAEMLAMVRELYGVEDQAKRRVAAVLKEQPDATAAIRNFVQLRIAAVASGCSLSTAATRGLILDAIKLAPWPASRRAFAIIVFGLEELARYGPNRRLR